MPFCTKCGNQVTTTDVFCGKCGMRQAATAGIPPQQDFFQALTPRTASLLCYVPIIGWVGSIIVLASPRFQHDRRVRFHAFQGLYLFVVWLIVDWVVSPFVHILPGPGGHEMMAVKSLMQLAVFGAWIFMLVKTSQEQMYHLPIVGELAERSLSEQR
jgi:uncharacterized membrane protein